MMNPPETRRRGLLALTEKEAVTDRTRILHEYPRPNSTDVRMDKVVKRFLIKRQEKFGT